MNPAFKISRTKIDLFLNCPRCFYLDVKMGVRRPDFPAFTLNSAVDHLLKKEFDIHRAKGERHPLMKTYGIDALPFAHKDLEKWRHNFTGIQHKHEPTGILVFGAIDDVWKDKAGKFLIVDYKATSKDEAPNLEGKWQQGFKRQMEVYQWLFRRNGFDVSDTGYFVYANGRRDRRAFDGRLEFDIQIIPYKGSDGWVEKTLFEIRDCLSRDSIPDSNENCVYCQYVSAAVSAGDKPQKARTRGESKIEPSEHTLF